MLILFRKCSTARAAEVNLLCLKPLFTPKSSSWCVAEALSQPEQVSWSSLCPGFHSRSLFSRLEGGRSSGVWGLLCWVSKIWFCSFLKYFFTFFPSLELELSIAMGSGRGGASLPGSKGALEMAVPALLALSSESPADLESGIWVQTLLDDEWGWSRSQVLC